MLNKQHIFDLLVLFFIMFTPSLSHGQRPQPPCGVSYDRWSVTEASEALGDAVDILAGVDECYDTEDYLVCRDAHNAMTTARDHMTQVLAVSRGTNCRHCDLGDIAGLGKQMEAFAKDLYGKGFKSVGGGYAWQYQALADEPLCHSTKTKTGDRASNLVGTHKLAFTCTSGCSGVWRHTMTVASIDQNGNFSGTGYYDADRGYTWNVKGQLLGDTVNFKKVYTGKNLGYTSTNSGKISSNGAMAGTGFSSTGQKFTWSN
jgi:hypothetical protein